MLQLFVLVIVVIILTNIIIPDARHYDYLKKHRLDIAVAADIALVQGEKLLDFIHSHEAANVPILAWFAIIAVLLGCLAKALNHLHFKKASRGARVTAGAVAVATVAATVAAEVAE